MATRRCHECGRRIEWVVLGMNLALFIMKGFFAVVSQSRSLLTDAFQSLANFLVTIVVLVSVKMASKSADQKFPYGYGKVEFLASGMVNMLLMIGAVVLVYVSFGEMIVADPERTPRLIAIVAAVISVVANQIAFGYGRCAGQKLGSTAIQANAMVNRADVGTSVVVIVAVIGSNLGFSRLDHIAAIAIGLLIVKVTFDGVRKAVKGLTDVSLHSQERGIRRLIETIDGVKGVGDVKARLIGRTLCVDVDVFVPDHWVVSKGLETIRKIEDVLRSNEDGISDVFVQLLPFQVAAKYYERRYPPEPVETG